MKGNATLGEFLDGFPSVTRDQALRFMEYSRDALLSYVDVPA